jgi:trans-aconitate methyltransferase
MIHHPTTFKPFERDWLAYYQAVAGRPPRNTLLTALNYFEAEAPVDSPRVAVDLGCGDGRDTVELLRRGWQVLAIDGEAQAIARLLERPDMNRDRLQT